MKYIVDRIEEGVAVCEKEDMEIINISLDVLPSEVREGSVLLYEDGKYCVLSDEEEERRRRILALQDDLFSE